MKQLARDIRAAFVAAFQRILARPHDAHLEITLHSARAELARRQSQLATSEQRLSLALEATGDGLWDYRRDEPTFFSDTYYRMLGYTPGGEAFRPLDWLRHIHPDDLCRVEEALRQIRVRETDLLAVEYRMRTAAGLWKWVSLRGRVIARGADGRPDRMIGTVQDVDRRRKADAELLENQEIFRNAFEETSVGMATVLLDGRFLRVNKPMCELTGYSEDELTRLTFQAITHPDDLNADLTFMSSVLSGERRHYTMEKRYVRKDGNVVWVHLDVGVVLDAAGRPVNFVAQVQNITERKQQQADLEAYAERLVQTKIQLERSTAELVTKTAEAEAAKEAAEAAALAKSAFLANISHEIRTPMAAIIGFADLLLDDRLPEAERQRCNETISRQGQHLLALINDILDLSKIEADEMTVECIECDPAQVLGDVEAMTAARAADKGLGLHIDLAADVPKRVRTDPTRLRQVLLNLVSNAIKFTHAGSISVTLRPCTMPNGTAGLAFAVIDTGIGIDASQFDRLFEPFRQADASTTRQFGGTGLGLTISKRLVEMMRGSIEVESRLGEGTRFEVRIETPAVAHTPGGPPHRSSDLPTGLRVLLAEDGPDNQRLITFYLRMAKVEAELAENGRIAVEKVLAAEAAGRPFDLVLMDMQMPEMDGCAAVEILRRSGVDLPMLALTAHASDDARQQSLRAGCQDHLVKPIDPRELIAAIARHTQPGPARPAAVLTAAGGRPWSDQTLN